jgi:hypothetical protein
MGEVTRPPVVVTVEYQESEIINVHGGCSGHGAMSGTRIKNQKLGSLCTIN